MSENDNGSNIFQELRTIGRICNSVPFDFAQRGAEGFLTATIGKSWLVYECRKLVVQFVGPSLPDVINAICTCAGRIYCATGKTITVCNRTELLGSLRHHKGTITHLEPLGNEYFMSMGKDNTFCVWEAKGENHAVIFDMEFPVEDPATCFLHPATYINKILIGFQSGLLQLWNFKSQKMIFEFPQFEAPITCMAQSPALDTIAVGLANGDIHVMNLKYNKMLMKFSHDNKRVTSLSFRTDNVPYLCSSASSGEIAIWNLEKKRLQQLISSAHDRTVAKVEFLPQKPLFLSSGADNSIKLWVFDTTDGKCRVLKHRSGHMSPPNVSKFFDRTWLLTAGSDRSLRLSHVYRDQQHTEFSQGNIQSLSKKTRQKAQSLKLMPIIDFDTSSRRTRRWSDVISIHEQSNSARVWRTDRKALTKVALSSGPSEDFATAVCISSDGHFGLIGRQSGIVSGNNLQSGKLRFEFQAHNTDIRGIAVNILNSKIYTAGADGRVKTWLFAGQLSHSFSNQAVSEVNLGEPIRAICFNKENDLLLAATDGLKVVLLDMEQQKKVRIFSGHQSPVSTMTFSPDGRWVVTATTLSHVRVFDILTGKLIDWFRFSDPVTSLAFSPDSALLATTHTNRIGTYIWLNKAYFSSVYTSTEPAEPVLMDPNAEIESDSDSEDSDSSSSSGSADATFESVTIESFQLDQNLITNSALPKSRWKNLAHWDIIQKRNKPTQPVEKPKDAPFFLPQMGGPKMDWDLSAFANVGSQKEAEVGEKRVMQQFSTTSKLVRLIHESKSSEALEYLLSLSPVAGDAELRCIGFNFGTEEAEMTYLLKFFDEQISTKQHFDILQAYLHLFLKIHASSISENKNLLSLVEKISEQVDAVWSELDDLFQNNLCLMDYMLSIG